MLDSSFTSPIPRPPYSFPLVLSLLHSFTILSIVDLQYCVSFRCIEQRFSYTHTFVVVQSLSCVWLFVTPLTAARQAFLSSTVSWRLLRFMSIESVMLSNHLILCCPLLLLPFFVNVNMFIIFFEFVSLADYYIILNIVFCTVE